MALSQDEQRVLAEIERRLAGEDPRLASSLATFRRPSPAAVLRSPRARIIGSLFTVLLVAMVSLTVYAMIPFRDHGGRAPAAPTAASQDRATVAGTSTAAHLRAIQQAPAASGGAPVRTAEGTPNSAAPSSKASTARVHSTASSQATGRSTPTVVGGP
jgi:hypothetical protein